MKRTQSHRQNKQQYRKPRLRTIELLAEEVLGVGCKLQNGGSAIGFPAACVNLNNCSQPGS